METALLEELLQSTETFRNWSPAPKSKSAKPPTISLGQGRSSTYSGKRYTNLVVTEKHYTVAEITEQWGISVRSGAGHVPAEEGVLKFDRPGSRVKRS